MPEILNTSQIESVFVSQPNKGISSTRACSRQRQKKKKKHEPSKVTVSPYYSAGAVDTRFEAPGSFRRSLITVYILISVHFKNQFAKKNVPLEHQDSLRSR